MKKNIILFAILIAMSYSIFAQNTPKIIWQKEIFNTPTATLKYNFNSLNFGFSQNGNSFFQIDHALPDGITHLSTAIGLNKNGLVSMDASNYVKNALFFSVNNQINDKYISLTAMSKGYMADTTLYLDKDFNYLKTLNTNLPNTKVFSVEDGIIYANTDKKFIKYDLNGKEEWQCQNIEPTILVNTKPPYIGLEGDASIQKKNMLILNKNGKKIGRTEPQVYYKTYSTPDKGFWLLTDGNYTQAEYIKFDSTGKQTAKFTLSDLPVRWQSDVTIKLDVMKNNGLFSIYMNDKAEIVFLRMMPDGSLNKSVKNLNISDVRDNMIRLEYRFVDENNCMFFCNYNKVSQFIGNTYIGVAKFDDVNLGWSKQIDDTGYGSTIKFNLDSENIFCIIDNYPVIRNGPTAGKLSLYNYDGSLRWNQSNQSQNGVVDFRRVNDFLYLKYIYVNIEFTSKVKYSDGTVIWTKPFSINSLTNDIKFDNLGNSYIKYVYCTDSSYTYCPKKLSRIIVSNKNDEVIGEYNVRWFNFALHFSA